MDRIVLEVDDKVGKIYRAFSKETKQRISQTISLMVKKAANDANRLNYTEFLNDIGNDAIKNGLTPEILESLLASDD